MSSVNLPVAWYMLPLPFDYFPYCCTNVMNTMTLCLTNSLILDRMLSILWELSQAAAMAKMMRNMQ